MGSKKRDEFASLNMTGVFACMCDVAPLLLLFCSRHVSSCCGVCWSRGSAVQCSAHWACPQSTQKSPKPELVDRITFILYDPVRLGGGYAASAMRLRLRHTVALGALRSLIRLLLSPIHTHTNTHTNTHQTAKANSQTSN